MDSANYSNHVLPPNALPSIDQLVFESTSPKYRKSNLLLNSLGTLILVLILLTVIFQPLFELSSNVLFNLKLAASAIAIIGSYVTIFCAFADKKKRYCIREHDMSYESGLMFRRMITQPLRRVQHAELKQGPIDRKLGLAKLQLFSAGGAMHTFEIPGLDFALAESIRQNVINYKKSV